MICNRCGYNNKEDDIFCCGCGQKLFTQSLEAAPAQTPSMVAESVKTKEKKDYSRLIWLLVVVLFIILSDVFLLSFLMDSFSQYKVV